MSDTPIQIPRNIAEEWARQHQAKTDRPLLRDARQAVFHVLKEERYLARGICEFINSIHCFCPVVKAGLVPPGIAEREWGRPPSWTPGLVAFATEWDSWTRDYWSRSPEAKTEEGSLSLNRPLAPQVVELV